MLTNHPPSEVIPISLFTTLLGTTWNGKRIWEHIRDDELIATPAFKGSKYGETDHLKIMFVGRDLNGWNETLADCSTLQATVESILNQNGEEALSTLVNENGYDGYYHKNSKFFRFIKHILENLGQSDHCPGKFDYSFYHDSKEWNQGIIWANLYCIAPKNPASSISAHPDNVMVKLGINEYIDLMQYYISSYEPDVVVFITDIDGWFIRWKRLKSFKDIIKAETFKRYDNNGIIAATGVICNSKVVICKRPDLRKYTYAYVEEIAKEVASYISDICTPLKV